MKRLFMYAAAVALAAAGILTAEPGSAWAAEESTQVIESNYVKKSKSQKNTDNEDTAAQTAAVTVSPVAVLAEKAAAAAEDLSEAVVTEAKAQAARQQEEERQAAIADTRQQLVAYALQFVGNPYVKGGNDPHTGADCSGFVRYVMQHAAGISMNRCSREQAQQGTSITSAQMQPGDLLFYGNGSRINHVAMYIGNGRVVHASTERTGIKTSVWNYRTPVRIVSMFG